MFEEENELPQGSGEPQDSAVNEPQNDAAESEPNTAANENTAVNEPQNDTSASQPQRASQKTSFAAKLKAVSDKLTKLPETFKGLAKKQKQIVLAITAGILILIIGLSVGISLILKNAGIVSSDGWDKAIGSTVAEFDKDSWNLYVKTTNKIIEISDGVSDETTEIQEFYLDGNKIKMILPDGTTTKERYYSLENEKVYVYEYEGTSYVRREVKKLYDAELDDYIEYEGVECFEKLKSIIKRYSKVSALPAFKGIRGGFEYKDGKYQINDRSIEEIKQIFENSDSSTELIDFTISFKNAKVTDFSITFKQTDGNDITETSYSAAYQFGDIQVKLPADYVNG
ncbi:MAG: hypothetical protein LBT30_05955 [Clostridiales bacterium]|jgi:hypothetical protein|nr:hypothetical protein [Clostridiales bacterium]